MDDHNEPPAPIGWPRALVTTAVIVVVAIGALVYGTNAVLTKIHGKTRSSLVAVATLMFFILLIALAWALRQLQRRKII
jgi:protein-S-isoprenylcysteine O-methyltransferase Ste14